MYQLTVSENQLKLINTALEEYFRIGMNQWEDLLDRIGYLRAEEEKEEQPSLFDLLGQEDRLWEKQE